MLAPMRLAFALLALCAVLVAQTPNVAVVPIALSGTEPEDRAFVEVAAAAAGFHEAPLLAWDGSDTAPLVAALRARDPVPDHVLFVVRPERFDITLHRRLLLALRGLDADPFVDAAFGYLTARNGAALAASWRRTVALHRDGLASRTWHSAGVASGMKSAIYRSNRSALEQAAGFSGDSFYFGTIENDPDVRTFVTDALPKLARAAVLEWSGNGDPQGIWLFDGQRNLDPSGHWSYDPARVGEDPHGEMPRLTADLVRSMRLDRTVVWSGTCHSAATHRVLLEGDIVATFGRAPAGTVHTLPLEQSLALAFLDAGAAALLAPVGPNHGMSAMRESEFALRHRATLGEAIKSTWDDVVLAAGGGLRLDLLVDGKIVAAGESVMQGGGANRVLLGDPTLRPFAAAVDSRQTVQVVRLDGGGFDVEVRWMDGFHARAWDMFGEDHTRGACVPVRIAVDDLLPATALEVRAELLAARTTAGFAFTHARLERFAGRRFLHLQANADRTLVDGKEQSVVFRVLP